MKGTVFPGLSGQIPPEAEGELAVESLGVNYGKVVALQGISFRVRGGRSLALLGRNGAGKSTLLKTIAGLHQPARGEIHWEGAPVSRSRQEIAYLPQRDEVDWSFPLSIRDLVEMGRYPHLGIWKRLTRRDAEAVDTAIRAMELEPIQHRQLRNLSGGQQQRAFIARALAQEARVLLLDEPFAGLDQKASVRLSDLLGALAREGRLIIASHHDLNTVREIFDDALLLNQKVIACGPAEEVLQEEAIRETFGLA